MVNTQSTLTDKQLLVGICGAVAASTMPSCLAWMQHTQKLKSIHIILTQAAQSFVATKALAAITKNEVSTTWESSTNYLVPHIQLTNEADLLLVMPATANMLGKVANGIADDVLSASIMAATIPVIFVPTMNGNMWDKASVQRNVTTLRGDGYHVIPPHQGIEVATGKVTVGAMPELPIIIQELNQILMS